MKRLPLMSIILESFNNIKDYDLTRLDCAEEFGVIRIKDFSNVPDSEKKIPFNDTYLIVFNDGTYAPLTCAEESLNYYIKELSRS